MLCLNVGDGWAWAERISCVVGFLFFLLCLCVCPSFECRPVITANTQMPRKPCSRLGFTSLKKTCASGDCPLFFWRLFRRDRFGIIVQTKEIGRASCRERV